MSTSSTPPGPGTGTVLLDKGSMDSGNKIVETLVKGYGCIGDILGDSVSGFQSLTVQS